jgi:aminopeptidase-like protein
MHALATELYPLCRSITGPGLRQTLSAIARQIPLEVSEVPSGTSVFDWQVPREWSVREAWIKDSAGRKIVDFERLNLHLVGYSIPVHATLSRAELLPHLHSLPEHPGWVPYRTSYWREDWGFCLTHAQLAGLPDGQYEVRIDSNLADGALTYGECCLPGESDEEFLVSCHVCHPSLANDNLSGVAVAVMLARYLAGVRRRYSYRFVFAPGTIGAITWLARNPDHVQRIRHGLVLALLGDRGGLTYKKSRRANAEIDRAMTHVLAHSGHEHAVREFEPLGYDERQYCSPGINLPVGCLMRSPPERFAEYHTSADNLERLRPSALADAWATCLAAIELLENNRRWVNLSPHGEPQLGRRGLYRLLGGTAPKQLEQALFWALNLSDGEHSLLDMAERSRLDFRVLVEAVAALRQCGLLASKEPE